MTFGHAARPMSGLASARRGYHRLWEARQHCRRGPNGVHLAASYFQAPFNGGGATGRHYSEVETCFGSLVAERVGFDILRQSLGDRRALATNQSPPALCRSLAFETKFQLDLNEPVRGYTSQPAP